MKTKTAEELRTEFEQETGRLINVYWEGEVDNPAYTCWLENKLIKEYASQKPVLTEEQIREWLTPRIKIIGDYSPIEVQVNTLKSFQSYLLSHQPKEQKDNPNFGEYPNIEHT